MNTTLRDWLALSLLDDAEHTLRRQVSPQLLDELVRLSVKSKSNAARPVPKPALPSLSQGSPNAHNPLFGSKPTLRELMNQYNGRSTAKKLLKNPDQQNFSFDRIESIRLPSIPGKILRPC
ncbi:MAG TPA: hypothetical protein PLH57_01785 [Oligoflexia bacterium]|nr:hypothetical protein [Oligoflexia bacterium]